MSRRRAIRRASVLVLAGNGLLLVLKAVAWWVSGSLAVGAETINSLTDVAYSVVIVAGLYVTTQPPDQDHPHGHERIEPFVSLLIAVGILGVAAGLLYSTALTLLGGSVATPTGGTAAGVLGVTIGLKYALYRYCLGVAARHESPAIEATALDNRTDIATAGAALVGVVGAQGGYPVLDPLAAGLVAVVIGATGVKIARQNLNYLVGAAPSAELETAIVTRAQSPPTVRGVHDVVAHHVGPEVDVSLHVEVPGDLSVEDAHDVEMAVIHAVGELDAVDDVFVHLDPQHEWRSEHTERPQYE